MYDLVDVKMDQKSFQKSIGRYKRSKFSSYLVYDPLTDKTSLKHPKWVIPGSLLGFGKCYFNFLLNILHVFYAKYAH